MNVGVEGAHLALTWGFLLGPTQNQGGRAESPALPVLQGKTLVSPRAWGVRFLCFHKPSGAGGESLYSFGT